MLEFLAHYIFVICILLFFGGGILINISDSLYKAKKIKKKWVGSIGYAFFVLIFIFVYIRLFELPKDVEDWLDCESVYGSSINLRDLNRDYPTLIEFIEKYPQNKHRNELLQAIKLNRDFIINYFKDKNNYSIIDDLFKNNDLPCTLAVKIVSNLENIPKSEQIWTNAINAFETDFSDKLQEYLSPFYVKVIRIPHDSKQLDYPIIYYKYTADLSPGYSFKGRPGIALLRIEGSWEYYKSNERQPIKKWKCRGGFPDTGEPRYDISEELLASESGNYAIRNVLDSLGVLVYDQTSYEKRITQGGKYSAPVYYKETNF